MNSEQIEKFKQEIECIIKEKNYISLQYVLFDETNKTPFAVHIFNKNDLFDFDQHTFLVRFQYTNLTKLNTGFFRNL